MTARRGKDGRFIPKQDSFAKIADVNRRMSIVNITETAIRHGKDQLLRDDIPKAEGRELALMTLVLASDRVARLRAGAL